ncbi:MAG: tRNA 5'-guanylyltransferase, partial [Methanospirillum sp.]|nr:tRNA 5'-guanylyltransferase [Methanospirillum sp.]
MKEREVYSGIGALSPLIVRLDGRSFHHFSKDQQFVRPFDERFAEAMVRVTADLFRDAGFAPEFGYTFSDEISLLFFLLPFEGRIEKIDSVLASFAASSLTIHLGLTEPVAFDSRVIPVTPDHIIPYLVWRQNEAWRNHINGWSQNLLMKEGFSAHDAAMRLNQVDSPGLHELCFSRGVNLARTPAWQRRGVLVYRSTREKEGYNPMNGETTLTFRQVVTIDRDLPLFHKPEGEELV